MKRRRDHSNGSSRTGTTGQKQARVDVKRGKYRTLLSKVETEKTSKLFGLKIVGAAGILAIILVPFIARFNNTTPDNEQVEVYKPRLLSAIVYEYINYNVQIINCMNLVRFIMQKNIKPSYTYVTVLTIANF